MTIDGWLIDTNHISRAIRDRDGVRERLRATKRTTLRVCTVIVAELEYGSLRSPTPEANRARWRHVIRDLPVLPFDEAAALEHARLRAALLHQPIGERDLLIAAIALANHLGVATANLGEFRRVPKLKVEDWSR